VQPGVALPDPVDEQDAHVYAALRDVFHWYRQQRERGVLYGTITLTLKGSDVELATQATRRYSLPKQR